MTGDQSSDQGMAGRLLAGRYRLESVLGRGGMGTVWRATDEILGRAVAVKELRFAVGVEEDERRRLVARTLTEAKAIARIRHTAAVTVYDVVEEDDRPWIVMELVESRSLSEVIRADGVLPPRRAAQIGLDLLGVLAEAHRSGILHRDVKPSNVLIGHDGRVVLTDFGIARMEGDPSVTSTGMLVGAPSYISPERARGGIPGAPADLWSLGATLYAMVEGHPPYDRGSALSTLTAVMTEELTPPRNGGELTPVIAGLLRKDPYERLDEATTRRMLVGVLSAPEPPAQRAPRVAQEPTVTLGAAPLTAPTRQQPLPASPPTPASAASAATVAGQASPSGPPPRRRRTGTLVLALVVLLLVAGTGAWLALAHQGKGTGTGQSGSTAGRAKASASAPYSAGPSASAQAAAGTYQRVQGPGGSSIEIPTGWTLVSRSASSWKYRGPAGTLQLDSTATPGHSAVAAWQNEEAQVSGNFANYQRVRLQTVSYRDGWDAADWEWTYTSRTGQALHALNRGFVPDPQHGYAIYWTAADATWHDVRNQELLRHFFSSFQPAA
ncbi:putative Ser/Thr protein kinase [Streptacidiphilus sp. MAP12-16]|uniref:serine/threonine-protein kinase n=1 Tax=Streptacidiphilus sp. MAP12-16 TaxID=3156300 RepID=UPI0035165822